MIRFLLIVVIWLMYSLADSARAADGVKQGERVQNQSVGTKEKAAPIHLPSGKIKFTPNPDEIDWELTRNIALFSLAAFLMEWIFLGLALRASCWFGLVDASLRQCVVLALWLNLLIGVGIGVAFSGQKFLPTSVPQSISISLICVLVLIFSVVVTKRTLECKWRSTVTVAVMAQFVGQTMLALIVWGAALMFPWVYSIYDRIVKSIS